MQSPRIPVIAGGLAAASMTAVIVAILAGEATTPLYIGAAIAAGAALLLGAAHLLANRAGTEAWTAVAPLAVITALLGVAASGASCGTACAAAAGPAAAATLFLPDLHHLRDRAAQRRSLARGRRGSAA